MSEEGEAGDGRPEAGKGAEREYHETRVRRAKGILPRRTRRGAKKAEFNHG